MLFYMNNIWKILDQCVNISQSLVSNEGGDNLKIFWKRQIFILEGLGNTLQYTGTK